MKFLIAILLLTTALLATNEATQQSKDIEMLRKAKANVTRHKQEEEDKRIRIIKEQKAAEAEEKAQREIEQEEAIQKEAINQADELKMLRKKKADADRIKENERQERIRVKQERQEAEAKEKIRRHEENLVKMEEDKQKMREEQALRYGEVWKCFWCNVLNYPNERYCIECKKPQNLQNWKCLWCETVNSKENANCVNVGCRAPYFGNTVNHNNDNQAVTQNDNGKIVLETKQNGQKCCDKKCVII